MAAVLQVNEQPSPWSDAGASDWAGAEVPWYFGVTAWPRRSASRAGGQMQGGGLILFAAVMLVIIGCFNLIYGIAAIANSHVFTANAHYVFANLRTWLTVMPAVSCPACSAASTISVSRGMSRCIDGPGFGQD